MRGSTGRKIAIIGTALLVVLVLLATTAVRLQRSRTMQLFGEFVTSGATADSVVALTFDDGPVPLFTDAVLELLKREGVVATFFVTGSSVAHHPELAARIVSQGHELGNHSYSHDRMVLMSLDRIQFEVEKTDSVIRAAGATNQIPFRPPFGKRLVGLPWYLSRTSRTTVLWSLEPDSWFREADEMLRHVAENVQPGSIILLHVEIPSRVQERAALPLIVGELKQRGYRFVTVSELLALGKS